MENDVSHVSRVETVEAMRRLNELERTAPIYRVALERIAGEHVHDPKREARDALREADRWSDSTRGV
jgi:hypothetical protein